MTDITIKKGDTPWALALTYTGNGANWPQFCKANPQLKADVAAGCLFYAGNTVHLPATWPAAPGGSPPAPMPGPVPQPVGPAVATPGPQVIDLDAPPAAPAPTPSLFSDPKKVMIAGGIVAGAIVLVYAIKKKSRAA